MKTGTRGGGGRVRGRETGTGIEIGRGRGEGGMRGRGEGGTRETGEVGMREEAGGRRIGGGGGMAREKGTKTGTMPEGGTGPLLPGEVGGRGDQILLLASRAWQASQKGEIPIQEDQACHLVWEDLTLVDPEWEDLVWGDQVWEVQAWVDQAWVVLVWVVQVWEDLEWEALVWEALVWEDLVWEVPEWEALAWEDLYLFWTCPTSLGPRRCPGVSTFQPLALYWNRTSWRGLKYPIAGIF